MAVSSIVLQLWKNGKSILAVKPGLKVDPKQSLFDTFDRVAFYSAAATTSAPTVVIDAIASSGVPDPGEDTYFSLSVDSGGLIKTLSLQCLIRCYVAGGMEPFVRFNGALIPSTVNSQWLAFDSLEFGEDAFSGFELDDLKTKSGHVPQGLAPVLPSVLGLKLKLGQSGRTEVSFKPAPQPAPASVAFSDPSVTQVVRFTRPIAFERTNQEIAVDPVRIAIAADLIASLGLDGGCASGSGLSAALTQTNLAITENLALSPTAVGRWAVTIQGVPSPGVIDSWNQSIEKPYLAALGTIAAGQPISGMPGLELPTDPASPACHSCAIATDVQGMVWAVVVNVLDKSLGHDALRQQDFGTSSSSHQALSIRSVQPVKSAVGTFLQANATFSALIRHDNVPLSTRLALFSPLAQAGRITKDANGSDQSRVESSDAGFLFAVRPLFPTADDLGAAAQRVRIGALDFEFGPVPEKALGSYGTDFNDDLPGSQSLVMAGFDANRFGPALPAVSISLRMRVERLTPGGQDNLPDEPFDPADTEIAVPDVPGPSDQVDSPDVVRARFQREPPVVILSNDAVSPNRFTIDLEEVANQTQSQNLSIRLYLRDAGVAGRSQPIRVTPGDDGTQRLVIIDRNPFLVARVNAPAFQGLAGADGSREVGIWSETDFSGASWALPGGSDGYPLTLPPQGMGEPFEELANSPGIAEGVALDFAFTPAASFSIVASPLVTNFTEASWNLRRIFGYPGERAPGALVKSLGFELLYGLPCEVTLATLSLAEIGARLGAVPGALPQSPSSPIVSDDAITEQGDFYNLVTTRWSRIYRSILSRLSVLEPWDADQPGTLTIDSSLEYSLRVTANTAFEPPHLASIKSLAFTSGILSRPYFSALGG